MSQKITAKNLQYNSSLPPFLARLRGQEAEARANGGPDPMLAGHRRIGKPRSASAEAEDAPLVVDERGEVVNLGDLNKAEEEDENGEKVVEAREGEGNSKKDEPVGGDDITKSKKKRKLGKVIGGRDEDEDDGGDNEDMKTKKDATNSTKDKLKTDNAKKEDGKGDSKKDGANKKKKAKKIKLSFGDEEEEG